jgi:TPR repeat protein
LAVVLLLFSNISAATLTRRHSGWNAPRLRHKRLAALEVLMTKSSVSRATVRDAAGWQVGIEMRVHACAEGSVEKAPLRRRIAFIIAGGLVIGLAPAFGFDGSTQNPPEKIPKNFTNAQQALRAGIDDLKAGDAESSVKALTYAAEGGQAIARWKLGEMYADGDGVQRDDVKAYHYFNQLVEDYDEDQPDRRNLSAISNAFVAVGVYCLNGIPNSDVRPDPRRAHELFQYAATIFGDPNAQYNLAQMYRAGSGGVAKDSVAAVRWLQVAAERGHPASQALLGHMLFVGEGVPHQRARGLMWLQVAKEGTPETRDVWIGDLYQRDFEAASDDDRQAAAAMHDARGKGTPSFPTVSGAVRSLVRPIGVPLFGAAQPVQ